MRGFVCVAMVLFVTLQSGRGRAQERPNKPDEETLWAHINCFSTADLKEYLDAYPDGNHAKTAKESVAVLDVLATLQGSKHIDRFFLAPTQMFAQGFEAVPKKAALIYKLEVSPNGLMVFQGDALCGGRVRESSFDIGIDMRNMGKIPAADGSILAYQTHGGWIRYPGSILMESSSNGKTIAIKTEGEDIVYFGVVKDIGLVHLLGKATMRVPERGEVVIQ